MERACSTHEKNRSAYRILVGNSEGKIPLGRSILRWVDTVNMDHREIGWNSMDLIDLA
jgi:hypothetical protein